MKSIIILLAVFAFVFPVSAQDNCDVKSLIDIQHLNGYEYTTQTKKVLISSGDTIERHIVVGERQKVRVLAGADKAIENFRWIICDEYEEIKPFIVDIKQVEKIVTEVVLDEKGKPKLDSWGEVMKTDKQTFVNDTVWEKRKVNREIVVFDSQNNATGQPYFQASFKVNKRYLIKLIAPAGQLKELCAVVAVGFKEKKEKTFEK